VVVLLILVVAVVVVMASVGFVSVGVRRRRGPELEPPPRLRPKAAGPAPTTGTEKRSATAGTEAPPGELTPEQVAEIEAALAAAGAEPLLQPDLVEIVEEPDVEVEAPVRPRFRDRLTKARGLFGGYLGGIRGRGKIDDETWDDLEEALLRADVGVATTNRLLADLRGRVKDESITDPEVLLAALKTDLKKVLAGGQRDLRFEPGPPNVWLFVGVNGVGKTTTIGKLGKSQAAAGRKVMMAAGDTFRAAAADQLELWAKRVGADLVRGAEGADPASIVFDAIQAADARGHQVVLADTAGRLHTKVNLMEELKKVRRVAEKANGQITEVLLVLDATTGQNGLTQAKLFTDAVELTGVVLTKLDGTAKGGIALAIEVDLGIPIKLVGLGETADDLVAFDPDEFVDALFAE
jgi:fused signal recognition particle receptor